MSTNRWIHSRAFRLVTATLAVSFTILAWTASGVAQTITGQVRDQGTGEPLSAVQVAIPGLEVGTLTGAGGMYVLSNVPAGTHAVEVIRIGYRRLLQEVTVTSGESLVVDFDLAREALELDAIVVTGTAGGSQVRAIGNVVDRVDVSSVMENAPIFTTEQAIRGRVPGVVATVGSSVAGADAGRIRIRGSSSIGLPNAPVVYVDGQRINSDRSRLPGTTDSGTYSRLNDIAPEDIESIEIIKGPAAATLYGTEAANGVIQIITKRGVEGAPRFDASVEVGTNWLANVEDEFPLLYGTVDGEIVTQRPYETETALHGREPYQKGLIQKYNLSVTGGTDMFQYFASANRSDAEGIVDFNWDRRHSGRLSLSALLTEALTVDMGAYYMKSATRRPGAIFAPFIRGRPARFVQGHQDRGLGSTPPKELGEGQREIMDNSRLSWTLEAAYNPLPWLSTRAVAGIDVNQEMLNDVTFREANAPNGFFGNAGTGRASVSSVRATNRSFDLSASATFQVTDQLGSVTSTGLQYLNRSDWSVNASGEDFLARPLTTIGATGLRSGSEDFFENTTLGVYVQQQFDWDNRVFVTGAVRMDDNSAFGDAFDAAVYPKLSATWVLHEEPFWNIDFVEQFRLRGAWGAAGQQPDIFAAQRLYEANAGVGDEPVVWPSLIGNPDLGPERGEELELGFDASFFDDRLEVLFTRYWKTTTDAIVRRDAPPSTGFPGDQFVNVGKVSNWGNELSVSADLVRGDRVRSTLNVAVATLGSRLDDAGGVGELAVRRTRWHVEGLPLASLYDYRVVSADFVSGDSGPVTNVMCDGGTGPNGWDMGGPPVPCEEAPRVYWGRGNEPTWTLNVGPTLTLFENVRFTANIYAQGGNMIGSNTISSRHSNWNNTLHSNTLDNPIVVAQRSVAPFVMGFYDAGYATFRELSLQYNLPTAWTQRFGASRAVVTVGAQNLGILWQEQKTSYITGEPLGHPEKTGIETEEFGGEQTPGQIPPLRAVTVNVRVSF